MKIEIPAPESIEVVLDGKTYTIDTITSEMMDAVTEAGSDGDLAAQAAVILGVEAEELKGVDVRILAGFFKQMTDHITSFAEDNPPTLPVTQE